MSVTGIGGGLASPLRPAAPAPAGERGDAERAGGLRPPHVGGGTRPTPREGVERTESRSAPPGVSEELWSVLTAEEREYFQQVRVAGPVTYGRGRLGVAELAVRRGGRLDVRV